jgi:hypothetical protein
MRCRCDLYFFSIIEAADEWHLILVGVIYFSITFTTWAYILVFKLFFNKNDVHM